MRPKRIVREKEACDRLGCRRTKFREHYKFNNPADPFVPGTDIPRLRPIPLGVRDVGYLDDEIDELIERIAARRDPAPAGAPRTTHVYLTDSKPNRPSEER
jgi:predicted DNA-binding transcriptional regulator AlpA